MAGVGDGKRRRSDAFPLYKLPGSFGCLVFNAAYPTGERIPQPAMDQIERILSEIRILGRNARNKTSSDHAQLCKLVAWYSRTILQQEQTKTGQASAVEGRVAHSDCNNTRAYFSPCKILEYVWEDCQGVTSCMARFEFFHSVLPRAGPVDQDNGGIEHDRFEGIPLW